MQGGSQGAHLQGVIFLELLGKELVVRAGHSHDARQNVVLVLLHLQQWRKGFNVLQYYTH